MLLREVEYARPETVAEAVRLLAGHDNARALAGGQSLVNVMKVRVASPDLVVDLNRIAELRAIRLDSGVLELGAMATYSAIIASADVRTARPILADVAVTIADTQVRNRGTIGGNLCSSDPTNHFPTLVAALDAELTIVGPEGERTVGADAFFEGVYMTAVAPGEVLRNVRLPAKDGAKDGWASMTLGRDGTGIVNVAACVRDGSARIAIGCVAATPVVVTAAADDESITAAVHGADLDPPSDVHASADYRRHLAEVLARRAVREAA